MSLQVIVCGKLFDGISDVLAEHQEVLIEDGFIREVSASVGRPEGADVIDLSARTVSPGFIDTHVHLTLDGMNLKTQMLDCDTVKAFRGIRIAQTYMRLGFTTVRDMGTLSNQFPTLDMRNAIQKGQVLGPEMIVAPHMLSASGGHGDAQSAYPCNCHLNLSRVGDSPTKLRELVRLEHAAGANWIKTMNTGGYYSYGDDPARVTWFEEEMQAVGEAAKQLGIPVAVHTGAAEGCKQGLRAGVRSLEHCYLIDDEGIAMAEKQGTFIVPTMQMTRVDKAQLAEGKLPEQAIWKFKRDVELIEAAQRRIAASTVKIAYGTDSGNFPFEQGIFEFQAMTAAGIAPLRCLKAGTSVAAELLELHDRGVIAAGKRADIVAMPGDPIQDISCTAKVDFVMKAGRVYRHGLIDLLQ